MQNYIQVPDNQILRKNVTNSPILNKQFANSYEVKQNKIEVGGKIIKQSLDKHCNEAIERNPAYINYQILKKNNKRDILNTICKKEINPYYNQVKKNSIPYIPCSIPDLTIRSIHRNNVQELGLKNSEILRGFNKFITPSPAKFKMPAEIRNRVSPTKNLKNPVLCCSNMNRVTNTKNCCNNFYGRPKKY